MSDEEWNIEPARIMGDMLSSLMFAAYESKPPREWLYIWEARACRYLLEQMGAGQSVGNDWTATFLDLNREAIMSGGNNPRVSFNLRAFSEGKNPARLGSQTGPLPLGLGGWVRGS